MKKPWPLLAAVLVLSVLAGCQNGDVPGGSTTAAPSGSADPAGFYISFTVTHNGEREDTFESDVYCYDPSGQKTQKIATVPYTAQYPLTAYDKESGLVYYASKSAKGKNFGDQLFSFQPGTGETKQLTQGIFAINYIIPVGSHQVFLGAAPLKAPVLAVRPFLYHTDTGQLEDLTWDTDLTFNILQYNPLDRSLAGAAFSAEDQDKKIAAQPEIPRVDSVNHMFLFEGKKAKELFTTPQNVTSLFVSNTSLLYRCGGEEQQGYSIGDGNGTLAPLPEKVKENFKALVYVTPDGQELYYLRYDNGTALCRYNAKKDEVTTIFAADINKEELNNATALSA